MIAAAEMAALLGLYRQEETQLINGIVWMGLILALVLLVWSSVVNRQWGYWRGWWASERTRSVWYVLFGLVGITGVAVKFLATF